MMYKMDMRVEYRFGEPPDVVLPFAGALCMEQRIYDVQSCTSVSDDVMVAHHYKRFSWLSVRIMKTKFSKIAKVFQLYGCNVNLKLYKYKNMYGDVCWERDFPHIDMEVQHG